MTTLEQLAGEAYDWFERAERADGTTFTRMKDDRPDWLHQVVYAAHGDLMPDDFRYRVIREAFGHIHDSCDPDGSLSDREEVADTFADDTDVYTGQLTGWLASHVTRYAYCDEWIEEIGPVHSTMPLLAGGQSIERREVFEAVHAGLVAHLEATEVTT